MAQLFLTAEKVSQDLFQSDIDTFLTSSETLAFKCWFKELSRLWELSWLYGR